MTQSNIQETELIIPGPAGDLQLLHAIPEKSNQNTVAIICHPHPQHGGTMQNKVVTTLHKAFSGYGLPTIRFNYRGVGKSQGEFANTEGETDDALAIVKWVLQQYPDCRIIMAGFSFGAYISYRVTADSHYAKYIKQLFSITMPQYPGLANLSKVNCPWLLVQGLSDEVVEPEAVFNWVTQLAHPPEVIKMPDTSHFFHGKLVVLREIISSHIQ